MSKKGYVYIITNKSKSLYIGVTSNINRRIYEHKNKLIEGFTKKYNIDKLIYCEECENIETAIEREKQLKHWHRKWKINLINEQNPDWKELDIE